MIDESEPTPEGNHVCLLKDGRHLGSSVIDVCMPDGEPAGSAGRWGWQAPGAPK